MCTFKNITNDITHRWDYGASNGYDGFDCLNISSFACLVNNNNEETFFLDCIDKENGDVLGSFNVGFNPIVYPFGLDEYVCDLLYELCFTYELEYLKVCNHCYPDDLDEIVLLQVRNNVLKHIRAVVSGQEDRFIREFGGKYPFRVNITKIF